MITLKAEGAIRGGSTQQQTGGGTWEHNEEESMSKAQCRVRPKCHGINHYFLC